MKTANLALLCLFLLSPVIGVQAEVYETTDEEGNTVFTDVPPTDDSRPLELESPNIADSVEVRPPEPAAEPPKEQPVQARENPESPPVYVDGDDDLREELYEERGRRELNERLPGAERPAARPAPRPAPHPGRR